MVQKPFVTGAPAPPQTPLREYKTPDPILQIDIADCVAPLTLQSDSDGHFWLLPHMRKKWIDTMYKEMLYYQYSDYNVG